MLVVQFHRHGSGPARQQIRWLELDGLIVAGTAVLLYFLPPLVGSSGLIVNLMGVIGVIFPLSIAVLILHHNLLDIDILLARSLEICSSPLTKTPVRQNKSA